MAGYGKAMKGFGKACKVKRKNLADGTKPSVEVEVSEYLDAPKKLGKNLSKTMRRVAKNIKVANLGKFLDKKKGKPIKEMKEEPSDD